jgi:hypothetical protein
MVSCSSPQSPEAQAWCDACLFAEKHLLLLNPLQALRHFCIESPISFPGVPLTVVEEEEIVEFWADHIQTINHIFKRKCRMKARPKPLVVYTSVQLDHPRYCASHFQFRLPTPAF